VLGSTRAREHDEELAGRLLFEAVGGGEVPHGALDSALPRRWPADRVPRGVVLGAASDGSLKLLNVPLRWLLAGSARDPREGLGTDSDAKSLPPPHEPLQCPEAARDLEDGLGATSDAVTSLLLAQELTEPRLLVLLGVLQLGVDSAFVCDTSVPPPQRMECCVLPSALPRRLPDVPKGGAPALGVLPPGATTPPRSVP